MSVCQFEMSTKDAVLDAIEQLKAQGVDVRLTFFLPANVVV